MADLPDLDTGNISYVAYWNAIDDGGVNSIDAEDALSDGNIQSYTLYDNGFECTYETFTGRNCTARVKSDGWFVAYFDRSGSYGESGNADNLRGYWDLANAWNSPGNSTLGNHTLERVINSLQANLSNSGAVSYSSDDVALYNYAHPESTASTLGSIYHGTTTLSKSGEFSYTSETTIHAAVAFGSYEADGTYQDQHQGTLFFDGTQFMQSGSNDRDDQHYGALELLNDGYLGSSGTAYTISTDLGWQDEDSCRINGNVMLVWG